MKSYCGQKQHGKFPLTVRIISAFLVISFIIYDISWANPDLSQFNNTNNTKLAPHSLFKNPTEETIDKFLAAFIYQKIEEERKRIGVTAERFNIDILSAILRNLENDNRTWFEKFNIHYKVSDSRDEVLIHINDSDILRYYLRYSDRNRFKYAHRIVDESPIPSASGGMHIQYLRMNTLAAGEEAVGSKNEQAANRRQETEKEGQPGKSNQVRHGPTAHDARAGGKDTAHRKKDEPLESHKLLLRLDVRTGRDEITYQNKTIRIDPRRPVMGGGNTELLIDGKKRSDIRDVRIFERLLMLRNILEAHMVQMTTPDDIFHGLPLEGDEEVAVEFYQDRISVTIGGNEYVLYLDDMVPPEADEVLAMVGKGRPFKINKGLEYKAVENAVQFLARLPFLLEGDDQEAIINRFKRMASEPWDEFWSKHVVRPSAAIWVKPANRHASRAGAAEAAAETNSKPGGEHTSQAGAVTRPPDGMSAMHLLEPAEEALCEGRYKEALRAAKDLLRKRGRVSGIGDATFEQAQRIAKAAGIGMKLVELKDADERLRREAEILPGQMIRALGYSLRVTDMAHRLRAGIRKGLVRKDILEGCRAALGDPLRRWSISRTDRKKGEASLERIDKLSKIADGQDALLIALMGMDRGVYEWNALGLEEARRKYLYLHLMEVGIFIERMAWKIPWRYAGLRQRLYEIAAILRQIWGREEPFPAAKIRDEVRALFAMAAGAAKRSGIEEEIPQVIRVAAYRLNELAKMMPSAQAELPLETPPANGHASAAGQLDAGSAHSAKSGAAQPELDRALGKLASLIPAGMTIDGLRRSIEPRNTNIGDPYRKAKGLPVTITLKADVFIENLPKGLRPPPDSRWLVYTYRDDPAQPYLNFESLLALPADESGETIISEGSVDIFRLTGEQYKALRQRALSVVPKMASSYDDEHQGISPWRGAYCRIITGPERRDSKGRILKDWAASLTNAGILGRRYVTAPGTRLTDAEMRLISDAARAAADGSGMKLLFPPAVGINPGFGGLKVKGVGPFAAFWALIRNRFVQEKYLSHITGHVPSAIRVAIFGYNNEYASALTRVKFEDYATLLPEPDSPDYATAEIDIVGIAGRFDPDDRDALSEVYVTPGIVPATLPRSLLLAVNRRIEDGDNAPLKGIGRIYARRNYAIEQRESKGKDMGISFAKADVLFLTGSPNSFTLEYARRFPGMIVIEATPDTAAPDAVAYLNRTKKLFVPYSTANVGGGYAFRQETDYILQRGKHKYNSYEHVSGGITGRTLANIWLLLRDLEERQKTDPDTYLSDIVKEANDEFRANVEGVVYAVYGLTRDMPLSEWESRSTEIVKRFTDEKMGSAGGLDSDALKGILMDIGYNLRQLELPYPLALRYAAFDWVYAKSVSPADIKTLKEETLFKGLKPGEKEADYRVDRMVAAYLLGQTGHSKEDKPEIVDLLARAMSLEEKYFGVRAEAAKSLGRIGHSRAIRPLKKKLMDRNDHNFYVNLWVRWSLERYGERVHWNKEIKEIESKLPEAEETARRYIEKHKARGEDYRDVVYDDPGDDVQKIFLDLADLKFNKALIFEMTGRREEARQWRQRAVPDYEDATLKLGLIPLSIMTFLAEIHFESENREEARRALYRIISLSQARRLFEGRRWKNAEGSGKPQEITKGELLLYTTKFRIDAVKKMLRVDGLKGDAPDTLGFVFMDYVRAHIEDFEKLPSDTLDDAKTASAAILKDFNKSNHRQVLMTNEKFAEMEPYYKLLLLASIGIHFRMDRIDDEIMKAVVNRRQPNIWEWKGFGSEKRGYMRWLFKAVGLEYSVNPLRRRPETVKPTPVVSAEGVSPAEPHGSAAGEITKSETVKPTRGVFSKVTQERDFEESLAALIAKTVSMRDALWPAGPAVSVRKDSLDQTAIILYADDILRQGAVMDLEYLLSRSNILDAVRLVIYGRDPPSADILEHVIRNAKPSINAENLIKVTSQDLKDRFADGRDLNRIAPDEAKELKCLLQFTSINPLTSGNVLGAIKGTTDPTYIAGIENLLSQQARKTAVVSFESKDGIYSFAAALAKLVEIKKVTGPSNGKWLVFLKPLERVSEEIIRAYSEYLLMFEETMTKA